MADICKIKKIKSRFIAGILVGSMAMITLSGCGENTGSDGVTENTYASTLGFTVKGDVEEPYFFNGNGEYTTYDFEVEGSTYDAITLEEIVQKSTPSLEEYQVLLIGSDGLTAEISSNKLAECNIFYTDEMGWQNVTEAYPISSQIKMIDQVVIASNDMLFDSVGLASGTENTFLSWSEIYKNGYEYILEFEGNSEIEGEGVTIYTREMGVKLDKVLTYDNKVAVYTKDGQLIYDNPDEDTEIIYEENRIDYRKSGGEVIENISGLVADPPLISITEVYNDVMYAMENDEKIMVIEIDGFGQMIYDFGVEKGVIPFISSLDKMTALSVYPTISNVGLASMLTGQQPNVTGVQVRGDKELKVDDAFAQLDEMGKTSLYVEGNTSLIETSLEPIISVAAEDQTSDEAVFENAMEAKAENTDFLYVHFHGVDDSASKFGVYSQENIQTMEEVDKMVEELMAGFEGRVIITADHGVYPESESSGVHGFISAENSVVPYISVQQ